MIYVEDNVVNLSRGDDAELLIPLQTEDGEVYEMAADEYLIFGVKEKPDDESPVLLEIESARGGNTIVFHHDDTNEMEIGAYSAEAQLMTHDGKRYTVWPKLTGAMRTSKSNRKNFILMTEVVRR